MGKIKCGLRLGKAEESPLLNVAGGIGVIEGPLDKPPALLYNEIKAKKSGVLRPRPTHVQKRRFYWLTKKGLKRVRNYFKRKLKREVDITQLSGKRIAMMTTPFSPILEQPTGTVRIAVLPVHFGTDGAGFFRHGFRYKPFKFTWMLGKGILLPESSVWMILKPEHAELAWAAFGAGADIVIDMDMAKLWKRGDPTEFEAEFGYDFGIHEEAGFWSGNISVPQSWIRYFLLPKALGFEVHASDQYVNLYNANIQRFLDGMADPDIANELIFQFSSTETDNEKDEADRFILAEILDRGVYIAEMENTLRRNLINGLKLAIRKFEIGRSIYHVMSPVIPAGTVVLHPATAKVLNLKEGDWVLVQKSPILPGDTVIGKLKIDKRAPIATVITCATEVPAGWDSDGDKVVVTNVFKVFKDEVSVNEFLRFKKAVDDATVHFKAVSPTKAEDEIRAIALGKEMIARTDSWVTRRILQVIQNKEKITVGGIGMTRGFMQAVINMANGKWISDPRVKSYMSGIVRSRIGRLGNSLDRAVISKFILLPKKQSDLGMIFKEGARFFPIHAEFKGFAKPDISLWNILAITELRTDVESSETIEDKLKAYDKEMKTLYRKWKDKERELDNKVENKIATQSDIRPERDKAQQDYLTQAAAIRRQYKIELGKMNPPAAVFWKSVKTVADSFDNEDQRTYFLARILSLVTVTPSVRDEFTTKYMDYLLNMIQIWSLVQKPEKWIGRRAYEIRMPFDSPNARRKLFAAMGITHHFQNITKDHIRNLVEFLGQKFREIEKR